MRFAMLVLLVACASPQKKRVAVEELDEAPPPATFRWSLEPLECDDRTRRSTIDTCAVPGQIGEDEHLIAVYAPISSEESRVAVIRYDGDSIGGPLHWQQHIDLGTDPHSAVVTVVRDTAIVAAISDGACNVVAIDAVGGRILGRATIVAEGARAVQVEGISDFARIHVRTRDGGVVAVMHPRTARVTAKRSVVDREIPDREIVAVTPTAQQLADISLDWENLRLVLRGPGWSRKLRIVTNNTEQAVHRGSMILTNRQVIVTIHDPEDARIEVAAFDRARGTPIWRTRVTGGSQRAFNIGLVRTELDEDQLLVYNSSNNFTCSVGLADGIERACVDRPGRQTVIDFPDDPILTP